MILAVLLTTLAWADGALAGGRVLFEDDFGAESQGERARNTVVDPPPAGMGYTTGTPNGRKLKNWLIADAEPKGPRKSFWCIPEDADGNVASEMCQAGRSRNSICFARTIIPRGTKRFVIEFRQRANDNDYTGFVLGAVQPMMQHGGFEFGYQRQLPGTDQTVEDAYYRGDLGEGVIKGGALMRRWASHRIEVDGRHVRWFQEDRLMLEGESKAPLDGGYFGFRQSYERGTRYDDVRITTADPPPAGRKNVLFISVDDLRLDLGRLGLGAVASPAIDKLAAEGVAFTRAYCQYPLCNPSRASVLTGLRPDDTGMNRNEIQNWYHFRSKLPRVETLPQAFQRAGYTVGRVGKLYHYGVPREIGTESALDDRRSWQFAHYPRGDEKDEEGDLVSYTPDRSPGWALSWQESRTPAHRHTDALVADRAVQLLEEHADRPFFLAVGFFRPHVPSTAPPAYFEHYPLGSVALPDEPEEHLANIPDAAIDPVFQAPSVRPDEYRRFKRAYQATITLVDEQIGRVVRALEDLDLAENTVVVLWSDHGWMLGEHGQWMKPTLFEHCALTPLVIRDPGAAGNGAPCRRVVELVDLYPTLLDLCGVEGPDNLAGRSLAPLLRQPEAAWPHPAFTQVSRRQGTGYSVRTERYRYTLWDTGDAELYDHQADPRELENLADAPGRQEDVRRLRRLVSDYRAAPRQPSGKLNQ